MNKYKVVSLFSGCGGMDLGFKGDFEFLGQRYLKHNFDIVFSNDFEKKACETYNYNFQNKSVLKDIRDIKNEDIPDCDVIIGGFPCQDFSLAGKRKGFDSERGKLYKEMSRIVIAKKPKIFIAENVEGLKISLNGVSLLDIILKEFKENGYNVDYKIFNAADYGVPQTRKRIIILGIRKDLNITPVFPNPIFSKENWITSKKAIDDLWDKIDCDSIKNHSSKDYSKAKFMEHGKGQGNRRIDADKPSVTIRAEHHGNIEGHYRSLNNENPESRKYWRRLSVRECARLQSFPDDFVFPCKASSSYKQIGNAVPPVFAWYIAKNTMRLLEQC